MNELTNHSWRWLWLSVRNVIYKELKHGIPVEQVGGFDRLNIMYSTKVNDAQLKQMYDDLNHYLVQRAKQFLFFFFCSPFNLFLGGPMMRMTFTKGKRSVFSRSPPYIRPSWSICGQQKVTSSVSNLSRRYTPVRKEVFVANRCVCLVRGSQILFRYSGSGSQVLLVVRGPD